MNPGEKLERVLAYLPEDPGRASVVARAEGLAAVEEDARRFGFVALLGRLLPADFPLRREDELAAKFQATRNQRVTLDLVGALGRAGVEAIVLKGAPLAAWLWPEPWLRHSSDIDLLIRPGDLARAAEALEDEGLRRAGLPVDSFGFGDDIDFVTASGLLVEVHYSPSWHFQSTFDIEGLFSRTRPVGLGLVPGDPASGGARIRPSRAGKPGRSPKRAKVVQGEVRVLSPADDLVQLCVHAAGHIFGGVKWLFDLKLFCRKPDLPWAEIIARAREARVAVVTGMALAEASARIRAPVPDDVLRELGPGGVRRALARSAQRIPPDATLVRSWAFDLLLADGLTRDWALRLVAPLIKRLARAGGIESRLHRFRLARREGVVVPPAPGRKAGS